MNQRQYFLLTLYHLSNIVKTQRKSVRIFTGGSKMPESICINNSYSNITMEGINNFCSSPLIPQQISIQQQKEGCRPHR